MSLLESMIRTETEQIPLGESEPPVVGWELWMKAWTVAAVMAGVFAATSVAADPCKAVPDSGPVPAYLRPGATFSGPVAYVGDGDSICVAIGVGHAAWVEVRIADFYAPELAEPGGREAKAAMSRLALGQRATCIAERRSYDRVVAQCRIAGRSLGDLMRANGAPKGGRGSGVNKVDARRR